MKNSISLLFIVIALASCQETDQQIIIKEPSEIQDVKASRSAVVFPERIPLPEGFSPEGIASGKGTSFFVGSLGTGAIYKGEFRTGAGSILVAPNGRTAVGLCYDPRTSYLYVSGGSDGEAYIYNGDTGEEIASIALSDQSGNFVNDCVVTREAVYFTNSFSDEYYRLPLDPNGQLPDPLNYQTIKLSDNFEILPGFNANGVVATKNGESLIINNSTTGKLYLVEPLTGEATLIDLAGGPLPAGDGMVLEGKTLYVVQNQLNQIAVVEMAPDFMSGEVIDLITDPAFDIPTTATIFGSSLYAVNARFGTPPEPTTEYDVIRVDKN